MFTNRIVKRGLRRDGLLFLLPVFLLLTASAGVAQIAPSRTWEELKAETQRRVDKNLTPVTGAKSEDAREALANIHSLDRDEWASAWSTIAQRYEKRAQEEETAANTSAARDDYFWAFRYYTIARWPVPNSPGKEKAYQNALAVFRSYAKYLDPPVQVVHIPFEGKDVIGYLRIPKATTPVPVVLIINGTDSRKEDQIQEGASLYHSGIGVVAVDAPGTGEAPIKADLGAERMFSRVLDYLGTRPEIDSKRMMAWGVSWGGHWSAQLGYVERARLRGVVVQGGPVDEFYTEEWQKKSLGTPEYLFDLFAARSAVYGVKTLDEFYAYGPRLSLKTQGLIGQPSAPMLLANGAKDTQVPISDLYLLLQSGGTAKEAWVNPEGGHTGRSDEWPNSKISEQIVAPWIKAHLAAGTERGRVESSAVRDNTR
jgi:esterase FrsA